MSIAEFLCAWNESITSVPIHELELKNPTESTFRKWLIAILRELFVDTTNFEMIEGETGIRARDLRVQLVHVVQHYYKLSFPNAKQDFVYMDLMVPNSKKVYTTLQSILNYNAYVRHMYNTTIRVAKESLIERDELMLERNQLRAEIESAKIKEGNISSSIKELDAKIPQQKNKIKDLEGKEKNLHAEIVRIQKERENSDITLTEMRTHMEEMKNSVVSDEEVKSILIAKQQIEELRQEQAEISLLGRQKLVENSKNVEQTSAIVASMQNILPSSDRIDTNCLKHESNEIENLNAEINSLEQKSLKIQAEITSIKQHSKTKEKLLDEVQKIRDEKQKEIKTKLSMQKKEIKELQKELQKLSTDDLNERDKNQKLRNQQNSLYKLSQNVLNHIAKYGSCKQ